MATTTNPTTVTELVATQWPVLATTLLACAAAWLLQALLKKDPMSKIPVVGLEFGNAEKRRAAFMQSAKDIYIDGYQKASRQMSSRK